MTPQDVVWYANHKYGELAYMVETDNAYLIFTEHSQWCIYKNDKERFGTYTLYHRNYADGAPEGFHPQFKIPNCSLLTYIAVMHDKCKKNAIPGVDGDIHGYDKFQDAWHLYLLGREIEERAATWDFLAAE